MFGRLRRAASAAVPNVVHTANSLKNSAVKTAKKVGNTVVRTTKIVTKTVQRSKVGRLVGKAVSSVPRTVKSAERTVLKVVSSVPKTVRAARRTVVKRAQEVKTNFTRTTKNVETQVTAVLNKTQKAIEKAKTIIREKNQRILEKIQEQNKVFAEDFVRGTTGKGALLFCYSTATHTPMPGVYNPSIEALDYLIQVRKAVVEEYPSMNWQADKYEEFKQTCGSYFNKIGNQYYKLNIPFLSDQLGAFSNCSDYQKYGNQTPLDKPFYRAINAVLLAKPSLIPGPFDTIKTGIRIYRNENTASTQGAYDRGFLIEGAGGMVDGIASLLINPWDAAEEIVNIYKEPEKYGPAIGKAAFEYVNDKVIHGSPEDRAKLKGRVHFEALALAASFIGGGEAEVPEVLGKVAETEKGVVTAEGIAKGEQTLTELKEAANMAKGAETAGELAKGENSLGKLLEKMQKLFKGETGLEDEIADGAGKVAKKKTGVSISKSKDGAEEAGNAGKSVGSGSEVIEGTGRVTKPSGIPDSSAKPKGNYAPNDTPGYIRQNESADLLSQSGYKVEMLDEVPGGNGYGVKETSNPDLLIENRVFDSYAPKPETSTKTIIRELSSKTKKQAPNIILNLDDYVGDVDELIIAIKQKATPSGDLKRLKDLKVIKDGKIINIFTD